MVLDRARCIAVSTLLNLRSSYNLSRKQIKTRPCAIAVATRQGYFLFYIFFILNNFIGKWRENEGDSKTLAGHSPNNNNNNIYNE